VGRHLQLLHLEEQLLLLRVQVAQLVLLLQVLERLRALAQQLLVLELLGHFGRAQLLAHLQLLHQQLELLVLVELGGAEPGLGLGLEHGLLGLLGGEELADGLTVS